MPTICGPGSSRNHSERSGVALRLLRSRGPREKITTALADPLERVCANAECGPVVHPVSAGREDVLAGKCRRSARRTLRPAGAEEVTGRPLGCAPLDELVWARATLLCPTSRGAFVPRRARSALRQPRRLDRAHRSLWSARERCGLACLSVGMTAAYPRRRERPNLAACAWVAQSPTGTATMFSAGGGPHRAGEP